MGRWHKERMAQISQDQKPRDQRTPETDTFHRTAKVIELIGNSKVGFEDAVQRALRDAGKSVRHISAADIIKTSVKCEEGEIIEYRVDMRVVFGIENR